MLLKGTVVSLLRIDYKVVNVEAEATRDTNACSRHNQDVVMRKPDPL